MARRKAKEDRICVGCGKQFETIASSRKKFCLRSCWYKYLSRTAAKKNIEIRTYKLCGRSFEVKRYSSRIYCTHRCSAIASRGKPRYRPPKCETKKEYRSRGRMITTPDGRHMLEYRYLAEQKIGRCLYRSEPVHHVDMDTRNNALENLWVYLDNSEHGKGHRSLDALVIPLLEKGVIGFKSGTYFLREG